MDDPLFDPWAAETDAPASHSPPRWRAPVRPVRAAPVRLAGTPGFLRTLVVPRFQEIAVKLQMARHDARVEDSLDASPPRVRLTVRLWRGPFNEQEGPAEGTLELALETAPTPEVVACTWIGPSSGPPAEEVTVSPPKLGAAWLESQVVDFLGRLLAVS